VTAVTSDGFAGEAWENAGPATKQRIIAANMGRTNMAASKWNLTLV
jgi:hypothetical protein